MALRLHVWPRWIHEICFSFDLAWLTIWSQATRKGTILFWYGDLPFVRYLYRHSGISLPEWVLEQILWSLCLAVVIFIVLRLLALGRLENLFLRIPAGTLAIAGFPVLAVSLPISFFRGPEPWSPAASHWLFVEIAISLICAFLYYFRKWPVPAGISVLFLVLHFGFWSWLTGAHLSLVAAIRWYGFMRAAFWASVIFYWGCPVFGFLASLAWGFYVRFIVHRDPIGSGPAPSAPTPMAS